MLYYFGDVRNPLEDTIKIVESYVKKYVNILVKFKFLKFSYLNPMIFV